MSLLNIFSLCFSIILFLLFLSSIKIQLNGILVLNESSNIQYCAKVMQTIIDEYREYRDISAIFNEIFLKRYIERYIVRAIVIFLGKISFPVNDISFPLCNISFLLHNKSFPLSEISFQFIVLAL